MHRNQVHKTVDTKRRTSNTHLNIKIMHSWNNKTSEPARSIKQEREGKKDKYIPEQASLKCSESVVSVGFPSIESRDAQRQ